MNLNDRKLLIFLVGLPVVIIVFFVGVYVGEDKSYVPNADVGDVSAITSEQFQPYWKVWHILDEKFVESSSTTPQQKIYGSIQGLASSYGDPYTVFFPPVESKMFEEDISGNFEGVGMEIGIKDKQLQVVSPLKGSPAERAGVKAGDFILKIDDKNTMDMSVDAAVKLIRHGQHSAFLVQSGTVEIRDVNGKMLGTAGREEEILISDIDHHYL